MDIAHRSDGAVILVFPTEEVCTAEVIIEHMVKRTRLGQRILDKALAEIEKQCPSLPAVYADTSGEDRP